MIEYYLSREVVLSLRVSLVYQFWICFILIIVLSVIAHAAFLQLLAWKEHPCDDVEAQ